MTRSPDVLFMAEYIKNVLYFATVRQGKSLKSTADTHYFSIDNELLYENYYCDFGPLNLGCVYKYCKLLSDKLKQYLNKQTIVHYTSIDPKKKANAAFLLGCYGVLYLSLTPRDALKPLTVHGQSYRPFQDATQGESIFTISILDCLLAIKKASDLGFFNFQDFNYEEYDRLDKIQGGDLNWIVPGKFLAFIGPVDYSVSLYHPPEMYLDYFMENNVKIVVRLNKRLYDGNVFSNVGITHYDLFFPDGSTPPRHILFKFMQISEDSDSAIAVHCKAGLGRTGSLIGCYLIKHYRMTSHEAIGWMRICRPGSVIGHQQEWLEKLETWLIKQGNIYRKRLYQDSDKLPYHEYGLYSIAEKAIKQGPTMFHKCPSPAPPIQRQTRPDIRIVERPQASRGALDGFRKTTEKESNDWRMRTLKLASKPSNKGDQFEMNNDSKRSGAGEPRMLRVHSRDSGGMMRNQSPCPISTFCTTQGPVVKTINDAKNFLMRSNAYNEERSKHLNSSVTITPHRHPAYNENELGPPPNSARVTPSSYSTVHRTATQPQYRRRLGRSPSPSPVRFEQTRATNTPVSAERIVVREASKSALEEALSRLKLTTWRDGSVGAASLGARRDAPNPKRAPSVRSDERPLATQGDMLNSIKFQRRLRESLHTNTPLIQDKSSSASRYKPIIKKVNSKCNTASRTSQEFNPKEKTSSTSRQLTRPVSPKGRRGISPSF
ncbi:dual specificity protein phosphatase CDC14A-like isoform X2 [Plodia interpunctella]|uniref:dual specificity protein phosphatase CDC14A-like isoform X2 n=1 Tax=Plodia interpunctella TaxID=58824 RepID=UPI00236831B2|nr:dual specificity protein phosphatase CDC14A-like isoform X2 [Plodia interpunctella]